MVAWPVLAEECEYVCEYVCDGVASGDYDYSKKVVLNEVYPAPLDGEDEFIELKNTGSKKISLNGWYLTDASGKKHELSGQLDDFLVIYQADSKIYLNNSGDEVNLYQPDDALLDSAIYDNEGESGWSYAREGEEWSWTTTSTPNKKNEIIQLEEEDDEDSESEEGEESEEDAENISVQSINEVRGLEKGAEVSVEGVVTALPDTLSSQIFYIEDSTGGIQIYSSKKTFPDLNIGDLVQVTGELSEAYDEKKINIKAEEQIQVLGEGEVSIGEVQTLGEELEGQLVSTSSQVTEKDGSKLYLTNDIIVYKKSAVDLSYKDLDEGDAITVTGIVGEYKGEYRLMPRSADDLVVNEKYESASEESVSLVKVAQAAETNGSDDSSWSLPTDPQEKNVLYILIAIIGVLFIALGVVFWKSEFRAKMEAWLKKKKSSSSTETP